MLFNSYVFILLFLPIVLVVYFLINRAEKYTLSKVWLIMASMFFCAWMNFSHLIILCIGILINYGFYCALHRYRKVVICVTGVLVNILFLGYFKYCNFFLENMNYFFYTNFAIVHIILPLGISFYTFQQIAFLVDSYREPNTNYSFLDYCVYICYFPKLIQGPMAYPQEIISQINDNTKKQWNYENAARGFYLFAIGLGKKVFLADTLAGIVALGYEQTGNLNSLTALVVSLSYTLQIYFDFSGYCDMAAGISYMFNIALPINFDLPYQARSISQFWKRWHITLTRFFTKYIYIPLGGSRKGLWQTCLNTMIIFLISGIWHGSAWTFVVWGLIHGALLVLERLTGRPTERLPKILGQIMTLFLVNITWIFFRADSLGQALGMIHNIFFGGSGGLDPRIVDCINNTVEASILFNIDGMGILTAVPGVLPAIFFAFSFLFILREKNNQKEFSEIVLNGKKVVITILIMVWGILSLAGHSEFIYFNF